MVVGERLTAAFRNCELHSVDRRAVVKFAEGFIRLIGDSQHAEEIAVPLDHSTLRGAKDAGAGQQSSKRQRIACWPTKKKERSEEKYSSNDIAPGNAHGSDHRYHGRTGSHDRDNHRTAIDRR